MSAFTDKIYRSWLSSRQAPSGRSGYGAAPHAERREGYPTGQANQPDTCHRPITTWRHPASPAGARDGSQRAEDAASRPEQQSAGVPTVSPFLHKPEKSSGQINH